MTQTLTPFPVSANVEAPSALAEQLLRGAEQQPLYDNKEFYSPALQMLVFERVRDACADGFDWLINEIKQRLSERPYAALVRGLRFDTGNKLLVAINRAFGELVARPYEKPRAQLIQYIQPATDMPSARGGRESERLHTDTADWEIPVELISMQCVHPDAGGGGHSRILDLDSVREEVRTRLGEEVLELLQSQAVPWQLASYCGGGVKWRTVLTESSMCWRRYTIELALTSNGARIGKEIINLLDAFEQTISASTRTIDFLMREGELLFSDNRRTIHARTPIVDCDTANRLMLRSWIRN